MTKKSVEFEQLVERIHRVLVRPGEDAPAPNFEPDWNVGPTKDQLVVYLHPETRQRVSEKMRWG